MTHLRLQIAISNTSFLLATKVIWSGIAWKYSHPAERMKNCNETRDVVGDSRRRYRVRGQRWEDPDCTNNQSERRIRYRPLREKYKYMLFTSREVRIGRNCAPLSWVPSEAYLLRRYSRRRAQWSYGMCHSLPPMISVWGTPLLSQLMARKVIVSKVSDKFWTCGSLLVCLLQ